MRVDRGEYRKLGGLGFGQVIGRGAARLAIALELLLGLSLAPLLNPALAQPSCSPDRDLPTMDLPTMMDQLLLDLPSYANRVIQRQSLKTRPHPSEPYELRSPLTYVLIAGQPEIVPLDNPTPGGAPLYQVFFTSLERQYVSSGEGLAQPRDIQQFHRLILAQVAPPEAWRVIRLRSQFGSYPRDRQPLSPPRNADQSPIAQAVRLWLRDCAVD